jgi:hypothetical protein
LPPDFEYSYFQSAPEDQQLPSLEPGLAFESTNLTPDRPFRFSLPAVAVPVTLRFGDRDERASPRPDTLLVEPGERRFLLTWRLRVPLGRKPGALREILVGPQPRAQEARTRNGKPHFASLAALAAWKRGEGPPEEP